jgi:hypothetical protein
MGYSEHPDHQDSRHQGSLTPHTSGPLHGYKPELGSIAQAEYKAELEHEAAGKKSRLARIGRALRRLFWEF